MIVLAFERGTASLALVKETQLIKLTYPEGKQSPSSREVRQKFLQQGLLPERLIDLKV